MTLTVYLAGPYAARDLLGEYARDLRSIGYTIGTRWLVENHEITDGTCGAAPDLADQQAASHAHDDLVDIDRCDVLVSFTQAATGVDGKRGVSGGRHVETGYAIAKGKHVVLVGEPENVFHRLSEVVHVEPDWHAAVLYLSAYLINHDPGLTVARAYLGGERW